MPSQDSEVVYLAHRADIERVIGVICRRHRLPAADAEDFASTVRLHLVEDDCRVLRQFAGRSSIATYLTVVITRQFQDWRNARWGKWRASAAAVRQGAVAVHLERLVVRDGLSADAAHEMLRTNFGVDIDREAVDRCLASLPVRSRRSFVPADALNGAAADAPDANAVVYQRELVGAARASADLLAQSIADLSAQDRLILRLRFGDGLSVAEIARATQLEQKPLYRRLEHLLAQLRRVLEAAGVNAARAAQLFEARGFDLLEADEPGWELWGRVRPFVTAWRAPARKAGIK